jgi:arylsulfatase
VPTPKESGFFSMLGSRAVWHKGWKAVSVHPTIAGWANYDKDRWELYNTVDDPTESNDLAASEPAKLQAMIKHWFDLAGMYNGLPLVDQMAVEVLADPTRPQIAPPRDRYVYYPGTAEVPESASVNIRNRNYTIAAEVDIQTPEAQGVLLSHGARFGGHSLYVKDRKLKYVYNFVGLKEQMIEATADIPTGMVVLSAAFEREGDTMPTTGTLSLYINEDKVGEGTIMTQPGNFSLVGEGLNVGKDPGEPVTDDYPGERPFAFTSGTIRQVIVDVSGEPVIDLEREAAAMMARE